MRRTRLAVVPLAAVSLVVVIGAAATAPATAANPPGTGLPSQSCQDLEPNTPGGSSSSPGSPFNEPGITSTSGGIGGAHYSATSQYDVACFQLSQR